MPYEKRGTTVYKKVAGKLVKVGQSTKAKIKHYLNTLRAVEHGWKKPKK